MPTHHASTHVLTDYHEPVMLKDSGLRDCLLVSISYHFTSLKKRGLAAWLSKLPLVSDAATPVDIDLSCVLLDKKFSVLEQIWYGKLRNANESIRHHGDALIGATNLEESLIQQEQIELRLGQLPDDVCHAVILLSNYHNQPLAATKKGVAFFGDKTNPKARQISFEQIEPDCHALIAWQLSRHDDDWQLTTPMRAIKLPKLTSQSADDIGISISQAVQENQPKRW